MTGNERYDEIDEVLERARAVREVDGARLDAVKEAMRTSLKPVRPVAPGWLWSSGAVAACVAVAIGGAARAGFAGVAKMSGWERALIFPALGALLLLAGSELVRAMIPGRLRRVSGGTLLGAGTAVLLGIFAVSFRDYTTTHFVSAGIVCLATGLLHALPAALLIVLLVRRGYAGNAARAGLIAGMLAGLAGLGVLELHCSNFEAAHVLVWHVAVVPLSAACGALCGWWIEARRGSSFSSRP